MSSFQIGEKAIYVRQGSPHFGETVTVVGPLKCRRIVEDHLDQSAIGSIFTGYRIRLPSGDELGAEPPWLRKIPPDYDGNTKIAWDDLGIGWMPKELA